MTEEVLVNRSGLKPCPFCGAEPLKSFLFDGGYFNCTIKCSVCHVSVCSVNKYDRLSKNNPAYIFIMTEREAESKWNRRHGQDDTQDAASRTAEGGKLNGDVDF